MGVMVGFDLLNIILLFCGSLFQFPTLILIILVFLKSVVVILFHLHFAVEDETNVNRKLTAGDSDSFTIVWEYPKILKYSKERFNIKLALGQDEATVGDDSF